MDKDARIYWQLADSHKKHSLEHLAHLHHLAEIALRHRQEVPLRQTLPFLLGWALLPLQLSRYALEVIGLVSPAAQYWLRNTGWRLLQTLRHPT
jgi:hypothetical protein